MEIVVLGSTLACLAVAAYGARAYILRQRSNHDDSDVSSGSSPAIDIADYLHGMRYRAWAGEGRELRFVEGRCEAVTGYFVDELAGDSPKNLADLIHPDDRDFAGGEIQKALDTSGTYAVNYRIRTKSGTWRWVTDRGGAATANGEGIVGTEGILLDISARKAAESACSAAERKYLLLAEHSTDLICVHDHEGHVEFVTPSVDRLLGYKPQDLKGRSFYAVIHPDDREEVRKHIGTLVRQDREEVSATYRLRTKSGKYVHVESSFRLYEDSDGYLTRFVSVTRDITEITRTRRTMETMRSRIASMADQKQSVLETLNHELQTPLTGILGFADGLTEEVAEQQRKMLDQIRASGDRMVSTISSIMDFSAAETRTSKVQPRGIDIVPPVAAEIDRHRAAAEERGVTLQLVREAESVTAVADADAVSRVMDQLLSNAIKFTPEDGVVTVAVLYDDDHAIVSVRDTGVGISQSFLPHVYEPFRQESVGLERKHDGVGLGLSIVKQLVDASGGSIDAESVKGKGTTFSVRFPTHSPVESGGSVTRASRKTREASTAAAAQRSAAVEEKKYGRVLAVDDNRSMRMILDRHLRGVFDVVTASDEDEALELASSDVFDVVLLDINLGGSRTGIDLLRELQRVPGYEDAYAIAITAYALPEEKHTFLKSGFDGFVSKPLTRQSLLKEISRVTAIAVPLETSTISTKKVAAVAA